MRVSKENAKVGNWRVDIIESERGWGSKVEDTEYFTDREEAVLWQKAYNEKYNPPGPAPDWYMMAQDPVQVR